MLLHPSFSETRKSLIILGASAAAGILAAAAIAQGRIEVALVVVGVVVAGAAYRILTFEMWCLLLLVNAVAGRGLVDILGLPQALNFAHYPIAFGFALAALARPQHEAAQRAGRWLLSFVGLTAVATVLAGSHPLRAALFLLIAGEPLLVLWAIIRWAPEPHSVARVGRTALAIMVIQIPLGLYQGVTLGWFDPVLGTLTNHGAGAHVLGGLFALAGFVLLAGIMANRIPPYAGGAGIAVCFGMVVAAGAIAVLVLSGVVIALFPLWSRTTLGRTRENTTRPRKSLVGGMLIGVVVAVGAASVIAAMVPGVYDRIPELLNFEELPERQMVAERASSDRLTLIFGSGPGTSASRASILLASPKEKSPVAALGLGPTEIGYEIAKETRDEFGGSAEAAASGALGVIGDLGLVGFVGLIALFIQIWRLLSRSGTWLAQAANAALLLVAGLLFLDNWLEYPEFALPFAMLLGISIRTAGKPT
jgi:hypothetical protein